MFLYLLLYFLTYLVVFSFIFTLTPALNIPSGTRVWYEHVYNRVALSSAPCRPAGELQPPGGPGARGLPLRVVAVPRLLPEDHHPLLL